MTFHPYLVGALEHFLFSHILYILGTLIPIDFHIFQKGGSTTRYCWIVLMAAERSFDSEEKTRLVWDVTAIESGLIVGGNSPKIILFQISEIFEFTQLCQF